MTGRPCRLERTYPEPITPQQQRQRQEQRQRRRDRNAGGGGGEDDEEEVFVEETTAVSKGMWLYDGIVSQMRLIAAHTVASVAESLGEERGAERGGGGAAARSNSFPCTPSLNASRHHLIDSAKKTPAHITSRGLLVSVKRAVRL